MSGSPLEIVRPPLDGPCGAAFTTRVGGVSKGPFAALNLAGTVGDDPVDVGRNRVDVCTALGLHPARVHVGTQVHGTHLRAIARDATPSPFLDATVRWPEGDGLITGEPGVGLGVFGADCLPVLLWRRDRASVAAVHAGWRGLVAGILEDAVAALGDPARTGAAIGPGIGPCCYPVSAEVRDRFAGRFGTTCLAGEAVDLAVAGRTALAHAGVPSSGIWVMGACTSCEPERWFSFRRDGAPTGRQAGIIWVEG